MDDIRRKLELIDKQLTGGFADSHKQIISTAPLLFAAVGLIAGITLQNKFDLAVWFWLAYIGACAAVTIILYVVYRNKEEQLPSLLAYTALVGFVCLGAIRLTTCYQAEPNDIRNLVADERKLATIRGVIITEPYIKKNRDWEFARFSHSDPASSFYLKLCEVETVTGWAKASGTVRVQVDEKVLDLKAGNYIQAYCWLDRFKKATNPGQFDIAEYLASKNVFIAASVKSRDGIELLGSNSDKNLFTKIKGEMRESAMQALSGDLSIEERNRGLLEALLLGYRGNIDSSTYLAFQKTGLLHFISLSGLHLGILAGVIWWLCKTAELLKRGRAIICTIAICVFLLIVPPRAPTLRAAIIVFVFCVSFFFRRGPNSLNTLSLAAIILLLIRPTGLFEAGWQLSFACVLGILLFCKRNYFFLHEKITGILSFNEAAKNKPFFQTASKLGVYLLQLFSTGLTAWLGGAGILLYHFYTIIPLASLWTVIVFPVVAGILTFGYLKITLSFLLPSAAIVLGVIVNFLSDLLIWLVKLLAHPDFSQILIGHVPVAIIILYYCFILFAFFVHLRRPMIKKIICTAMILVVIVFLGATKWQRTHRDNLIMTCLDVGHGQAILAQMPGGENILFDAGSMYGSDIGRRIVAPFLAYSGINRIDSIIISHNDVDHINGIPEIAECCEVGGVYANDAFFSQMEQWGTAKFLKESLSKKGLEVQRLGKELNLNSNAKVKIIWPNEQTSVIDEFSDNNKSVVSLIEFADKKILLCSDIEKLAQAELLRLNPNLKVDVIVVPHHGSIKTTEQYFIENLGADILICSCGWRDYQRQQATTTGNKPKSFYTAKDGALTIYTGKDGTVKTAVFVKQK
ncbi:MAG: ComEC/Rec2 family competence protein [Phycisphaerae bacterium]|nr:ComEC/Rec2 family competence protein [Phycisphaerae bacterium]